jgi:hypothetical protein
MGQVIKVFAFCAATMLCGGCVADYEDARDISSDEGETTAEAASALSCHYKVIWSVAGVYEKPTASSKKRKNKYAQDIVGGYGCDWIESPDGIPYLAVVTASAEDGIGWMRRDALVKY